MHGAYYHKTKGLLKECLDLKQMLRGFKICDFANNNKKKNFFFCHPLLLLVMILIYFCFFFCV